jgi:HEAT repeat protein
VRLHQSVRGEASAGLNRVGLALGCADMAHDLLRSGQRARQLLAILALGHLRDRKAWDGLLRASASADPATSVHALWALVQIDPAQAARELAPLLLRRDDWALSQVAKILQDAHPHWTPVLVAALPQLPPERIPGALRLLEGLRATVPAPLLHGLLRHDAVDVLIAVLRMAAVPDMLDLVRSHLGHADWRVRLQAARALGRIGDASDVPRLQGMLGDSQWWVRYRAAQALADMPFLTGADIQAVCEGADRFGADMMRQVLAEKEAI